MPTANVTFDMDDDINMSDAPTIANQYTASSSLPPLPKKRRKRKNKNKKQNKPLNANKKVIKRKLSGEAKTVLTMTAWAEQFTFAATWQLKHQLAYWKAKAKALQYENGVLHDIIRQNQNVDGDLSYPTTSKLPDGSDDEKEEHEEIHIKNEDINMEETELGQWKQTDGIKCSKADIQIESDDSDILEDKNLEVSEEYIQFLMVNAKHKEQIRLERERLKNLEVEEAAQERERKLKARRHYGLSMQELYGDNWQKISALEMSMKCGFLSVMDSSRPEFWPVIPFNFDVVHV